MKTFEEILFDVQCDSMFDDVPKTDEEIELEAKKVGKHTIITTK